MATAREFVARVDAIDGVDGCLLVREDGHLLAQTIDNAETYSSLVVISGSYAREVMEKAGFSHCRFVSFHREGKQNFHVFPIDRYFLAVVQTPSSSLQEMIDNVTYLVGRVTNGGAEQKVSPTEPGEGDAPDS